MREVALSRFRLLAELVQVAAHSVALGLSAFSLRLVSTCSQLELLQSCSAKSAEKNACALFVPPLSVVQLPHTTIATRQGFSMSAHYSLVVEQHSVRTPMKECCVFACDTQSFAALVATALETRGAVSCSFLLYRLLFKLLRWQHVPRLLPGVVLFAGVGVLKNRLRQAGGCRKTSAKLALFLLVL